MGMTLKKTEMLEYEKGKEVRTYSDIVYTRTAIDQLSNREEESNSKKY